MAVDLLPAAVGGALLLLPAVMLLLFLFIVTTEIPRERETQLPNKLVRHGRLEFARCDWLTEYRYDL